MLSIPVYCSCKVKLKKKKKILSLSLSTGLKQNPWPKTIGFDTAMGFDGLGLP